MAKEYLVLFFCLILSGVHAEGSALKSVPFSTPLTRIPERFLIDSTYISSVEFRTVVTTPDRFPGIGQPLLLTECLEWIADSTADPIPSTIDSVTTEAKRIGFRLLELKDLQAKSAQVLLANGTYLIALIQTKMGAERMKQRDMGWYKDTVFTPTAWYFHVICGYKQLAKSRESFECRLSFDFIDGTSIIVEDSQLLGPAAWPINGPFGPLPLQRARIERVFAVVASNETEGSLLHRLENAMDGIPLRFRTPKVVDPMKKGKGL